MEEVEVDFNSDSGSDVEGNTATELWKAMRICYCNLYYTIY